MTTSRKRGAPAKNKNALKHGIYTQFILLADEQAMKNMSDKNLKDELTITRVRFVEALKERNKSKSVKKKLGWDFATHYWLEMIINIKTKAEAKEEAGKEVWTSLLEAVRRSNDRQGVRR
jgi:hypothetical protein